MSECARRTDRTGSGVARRAGAWAAAAVLVATLAGGCGSQPAPTASPAAATPAPATTATPAPTSTPVAYADTLRVGFGIGWLLAGTTNTPSSYVYRGLYQGGIAPSLNFQSVVYSGLYRYDAHFGVVPDLADGPCFIPGADATVIRCHLIETTFQDGAPLTADDVAYSYGLFRRLPVYTTPTLGLKEVRVVDPRTIDFALSSVDPTFLTIVLPTIPILPQHAVEAAYADFVAATKGFRAKDLTKLAATIDEETGRDPPPCPTRLDEVDAFFAKLGAHLYLEDYPDANGAFDPCWYMRLASAEIATVAAALGDTGPQAVADAFMFFAAFRPPVGTGPYRYVSQTADRIHLEAWPGYHGGLAATEYLDFVKGGAESDLTGGLVDILQDGPLATPTSGVRVATVPTTGFSTLFINVREGRLFADVNLRKALQLCIDLPRDVDAATGGGNMPIYSPVLPGSWADDPAIPKTARDTTAAKRLIEAAGWQLGADGVYAKDGVRLAAGIVVRGEDTYRTKMADLIADEARDCGMDLRSRSTAFADIGAMLDHYPHDIPGTKTLFDLYIGGWSTWADPWAPLSLFDSSSASDAQHPDYPNVGGFSDPAFDRLLAAGAATYDQADRTRIYRQAQEELAAQVPAIFLWNYLSRDDVRSAVATVDGPLDLTVPHWAWQPERMVVAASP